MADPRSPLNASDIPEWWVDHDAAGAPEPREPWLRSLYAVCEVLFATHDGPPPPDRLRWLCAELKDMEACVGGKGFAAIKASLVAINWVAPLWGPSLPSMRRMEFEKRRKALERFERGPMGLTVFAIKALTSMVYYEHPDAAADIGFDGRGLGSMKDRGLA